MSRRTEPGSWGRIKVTELDSGTWEAEARYCGFDGRAHRMRARGDNEPEAREALVANLMRRRTAEGIDAELTGSSTVEQLAEAYLAHKEADGLRSRSITVYRSTINNQVLPVIGGRRLTEIRTSVLTKVVRDRQAAGRNPTQLRKVLSGMFGYATQFDIYTTNPVTNVPRIRLESDPVRALTMEEIQEIRALIDADMLRGRPGPKPTNDLRDLVDVLLATGCRLGEGIGLIYSEMDLSAAAPTVTVSGTVKNEKGMGTYRQPRTKTDAGWRTLYVPPFAVEILLRRIVENPPNEMGAVFPTRNGKWRQDSGWERIWRRVVKGTKYDWVTFHTFRKSVATLIADEIGLDAAQSQLGHDDGKVTSTYYVAQPDVAPDLTRYLERFRPST